MEENKAFCKAKTSISQGVPKFGRVCQILAKCAKLSQGVPNFRMVCENHFVHTDLRDLSPEL